MSWFDRLFGESKEQEPPAVETIEESHEDIYRRPKGKFRFPIDVDHTAEQQESRDVKEETTAESYVNDDYFNSRRAKRHVPESRRERIEEPEQSFSEVLRNKEIHRPKFTASEVPSAIYGTRKNLKQTESKVVITPLTGRKPEVGQPETPTYRQADNVVNVENVYASQIVAEIRREREKKAQARREFEEKRRQIKLQETQPVVDDVIETLDDETVDHVTIEPTPSDTVAAEAQFEETVRIIADEPSPDDTAHVKFVDLPPDSEVEIEPVEIETIEIEPVELEAASVDEQSFEEVVVDLDEVVEEEEPEIVEDVINPIETQPVQSYEPMLKPTIKAQTETTQSQEFQTKEEPETPSVQRITEEKSKSRPFNVVMTPSDKKRMMDTKTDSKVKRKGPKYLLPPVSLLAPVEEPHDDQEWVDQQKQQLDEAFYHFNVPAKVENVVVGPSVTRYELSVEKGVKVSRITNLQDDIKMALAAKDIRIEAPIPGTSRVGVEVPNIQTRKVNLSEVIFSKRFKFAESNLMVALGVKINNEPMLMDIAKMPHALIAGATGSGKSVSINTILMSLLYRNNPNELKLLLIDPKMVELAPYNDLPHLIAPVITDVKAATESLKWVVEEMERRYKRFADVHVRNISAYNQKAAYDKRMPKIVIIIDELADLMMMAPQEVEHSIARIAQKARAAGIHLILATQRPSVNVITGLIKANVPTRIAFMVSSSIDSRTILDNGGAEKLLGNGDMLYQGNGMNKPVRIQGCYVSDEEIDAVISYVKSQGEPNYLFQEKELLEKINEVPQDDLFDEVVQFMQEEGHISTSQLQRRFQIGYNRAARIIDSLEAIGYISGANGSKPRTVLMTEKQD